MIGCDAGDSGEEDDVGGRCGPEDLISAKAGLAGCEPATESGIRGDEAGGVAPKAEAGRAFTSDRVFRLQRVEIIHFRFLPYLRDALRTPAGRVPRGRCWLRCARSAPLRTPALLGRFVCGVARHSPHHRKTGVLVEKTATGVSDFTDDKNPPCPYAPTVAADRASASTSCAPTPTSEATRPSSIKTAEGVPPELNTWLAPK